MQMNKWGNIGIEIIPITLILVIFFSYFDIFFSKRKNKYQIVCSAIIFLAWQIVTCIIQDIPINIKLSITIMESWRINAFLQFLLMLFGCN